MRHLARIIEAIVVLAMGVIAVIVFTEVVLRYGFGRSLDFTEELTRYLMIWVVFLAGALCVRQDAHIRIDMLVRKLPRGWRPAVEALAHLCSAAFLLVLAWAGYVVLPGQTSQETVTLGVSMAWPYAAIPVGCVLMVIFLVARMRKPGGAPRDDDRA